LLCCGAICAAALADQAKVKIVGREEAIVTTDTTRLSDLAEITSADPNSDEVVIGLQKLILVNSPQPGQQSALSALQIINRIREEGVNLEQVGYSFPKMVKIIRASRPLESDELARVMADFMSRSGREVTVRNVYFKNQVAVAPGEVSFELEPYDTGRAGRQGFNIIGHVNGAPDVHFSAEAELDEWKELPVASRQVLRGEIVGAEDVVRARINLTALGRDTAINERDIVGMEASRTINPGEPFGTSKLVVPPIITNGSKVTMVYKGELFEATASGIAMENAIPGQSIKVRNDTSKKVVNGIALESGLVEVKP